ncbi:MAG: superinfection exclusion B family protein [Deltaproteobacteria bacterium]|nr:superinfection exclusion B family protein [Deltaproteobacteria bacterium]
MNWFTSFLKAVQLLPSRYFFAMAAVGVFFLVLPMSLSQWLGTEGVLARARGWIALATSITFFLGIAKVTPWISRWWSRRRSINRVLESLDSLSADERILLGYCAARKRRTILLQLASAEANVAHGLCQKGLMEQAPGQGSILGWPFTIPAEIWPHVVNRVEFFLGKNWKNNDEIQKRLLNLDHRTSAQAGGYDF